MFDKLDPLLHSQLRLAIISLLVANKELDFNGLKAQTKATSGNLSIQLKKLEAANYININKTFENNYPKTTCTITKKGLNAFEAYVQNILPYLNIRKDDNS